MRLAPRSMLLSGLRRATRRLCLPGRHGALQATHLILQVLVDVCRQRTAVLDWRVQALSRGHFGVWKRCMRFGWLLLLVGGGEREGRGGHLSHQFMEGSIWTIQVQWGWPWVLEAFLRRMAVDGWRGCTDKLRGRADICIMHGGLGMDQIP